MCKTCLPKSVLSAAAQRSLSFRMWFNCPSITLVGIDTSQTGNRWRSAAFTNGNHGHDGYNRPIPVFPHNLRPMPLRRHPEPFSDPAYLFELKHDGFRALAKVRDGACRLISRNGNAFGSFSMLCEAIAGELPCDAVLDGEIVVLADDGRSLFNELLFRRGEPRFYAFDMLWCDGEDLRFSGLADRKRKLRSLITGRERLLYCDHLDEHGERLFQFACENDLEGIVAKPRNSPYVFTDRQTPWLKIRNRDYTQMLGRDELFSYAD
jgi:bifunctional non-homologous end joining protein LigD